MDNLCRNMLGGNKYGCYQLIRIECSYVLTEYTTIVYHDGNRTVCTTCLFFPPRTAFASFPHSLFMFRMIFTMNLDFLSLKQH
jgi:hypothetical protein